MMTACLDADAIGAPSAQVRERLRVLVRGAVQGVGFRPFVYRLARELSLAGWVQNSPEGVTIEVEGAMPDIAEFRRRLRPEAPPRATIVGLDAEDVGRLGGDAFMIRESEALGPRTALVPPDAAVCAEEGR